MTHCSNFKLLYKNAFKLIDLEMHLYAMINTGKSDRTWEIEMDPKIWPCFSTEENYKMAQTGW